MKVMVTPLLTTKLCVPPTRPALVSRPQLIERLNAGLRQKLILVAAPAGFGKTTLLSAWLSHCNVPVAWFSVDEDDNDPIRFLAYLSAALASLDGTAEGSPLEAWDIAAPDPEIALTTLINRLNVLFSDCILVLDDYHLITAQPVHDMLTFLLNNLPRTMHLVIASRADPPLPVARLRGGGQLTELRQADLRFTVDEAAEFLQHVTGLSLAADDAVALNTRAEGWVAGLQMAAISMQGREDVAGFIRALSGSNRYILDYLVEEVIERQPHDIQTFLCQTAILDRLSGALCDAVLYQEPPEHPTPRGQAILEYLERANLFIVPLDDRREWYRYHRLFGDLLRQRLRRTAPEQVQSLHRRAATWYESQGDVPEAIAHAFAAEDFAWAAALVAQVAETTLLRGEIVTLLNWVQQLPDDTVRATPSLCVFRAWAMLLSGHSLSLIEAHLHDAEAYSDLIPGQIAALRAMLAIYQMQLPRAIALAHQALEQLPEESVLLRNLAIWIVSTTDTLVGITPSGDHALDLMAQQGLASGNVLVAMMSLNQLAEFHARHGRLHQAWNLYQKALNCAVDAQGRRMPIAGTVLVGLGDLACEWHDYDAALRYFQEGIVLIEQWNEVGALEAYLGLSYLYWLQGDVDATQAAIEQARQLAVKFDITEYDDWVVAIMQARVWIALGNLDAVQHWAEARGLYALPTDALSPEKDMLPENRLRKYELAALARLYIAQGDPAAALTVLASILPVAQRQQRPALLIEIHLLEALAFEAQGQRAQALAVLEEALALAEPEGYTRAFLSVGQAPVPLLREAVRRGLHAAYAARLLAFLAPAAQDTALPAPPSPGGALFEPLTEREREVLHLLASALSTDEIAQTLYLSVHTVRSHLKSLYSKLDVHSRYEAVARAQDLHLL